MRSTLLGEAGWRRAISQKPELLTMGRIYNGGSDSARPIRRTKLAATAVISVDHSTEPPVRRRGSSSSSGRPTTLGFFSPDQAVEIESVAAQIIPKDETPGAREAGTIYFIDRALTTFDEDKQAAYRQGLKDLQAKLDEYVRTRVRRVLGRGDNDRKCDKSPSKPHDCDKDDHDKDHKDK